MKKKLLVSLVMVLGLIGAIAPPAYAIVPTGVYYNFNAVGGEAALIIDWSGHSDTVVTADDFRLQKKETTTAEVEARIYAEKIDDLIKEDILWNQLDPEEEPALSGVLSPGEEIVYIPQQKLRVWKAWVGLHIYSLDNPETPESELRFVTRTWKRSVFPGGTTHEEIFPDGWWPGA